MKNDLSKSKVKIFTLIFFLKHTLLTYMQSSFVYVILTI